MNDLERAMEEVQRARQDVSDSGIQTELESIAVSLEEMVDAEEGEKTDAEAAFGDADFTGSAPSVDNLESLEGSLLQLVDNTEDKAIRDRLEAAQGYVAAYRIEEYDDE